MKFDSVTVRDIKNKIQSLTVRHLLTVLILLIVGLLIFQAGMLVGFHKAAFSYRMGDNYYRAIGPEHGAFGLPFDEHLPDAHGAAGMVLSVALPTFVIDDHGTEKTIMITGNTLVRRFRDSASTTDIKANDFVVILGSPLESGSIDAKLIRILPKDASTTAPQ